MDHNLTIAAIQMVSVTSAEINLQQAEKLIIQAAQQGAKLIILPEFFIRIANRFDNEFRTIIEPLGSGRIQDKLASIAQNNKIFLVAGTIPIQSHIDKKCYNTTLVYDPSGKLICHYHKIHLFQFDSGERKFDEGAIFTPGETVSKFAIDDLNFGLAICYDIRFPELFRKLAGVDAFIVPAAFLYRTGAAHWEILLRARAIENQCYIIASCQGGIHDDGRHTFGHSMLINPWGEVETILKSGEGMITGQIKKSILEKIRQDMPALHNRRI